MTLKPCLQCGEPSDRSRCPAHRPCCTKTSRQSRGYDAAWQKLSTRARRLQPFCTRCGATEDLQADHTPEAWARHDAGLPIRLRDIDVLCGPCNRDAGAARGDAPTRRQQHPGVKAKFELLTFREVRAKLTERLIARNPIVASPKCHQHADQGGHPSQEIFDGQAVSNEHFQQVCRGGGVSCPLVNQRSQVCECIFRVLSVLRGYFHGAIVA